ncbi:uncharacterized protein LOC126687502 [Mercurialis annua]|uniref:uncharacterized protein LOC126687502 n=1 Tax=Mercurialis annua TaxID=3986 RepID=UPI00215E05E1|nr:uncharacterized protein LOC126687502 [Mercurialis annua]
MLFSSATPTVNRQAAQDIMGYKVVSQFKKYIGLPTMVDWSKKPIFGFLRDRLHKRVLGWKEKFLPKAGREVLIKSIAQSIPTYIMSCFALPVSFCNEMQSIITKLWWSGTDDKRKISCVSWLNGGRVLASCGVLFLKEEAKWDLGKLQIAFSPNDVDHILQIPISFRLPPDKLFWVPNKNSVYSVKSGYFQVRNLVDRDRASSLGGSTLRSFWRQIWRCNIQPKVKPFLWHIGHDSLPCNVNLSKRMPMMPKSCPRCRLEEASDLHALKDCEEVRGLWLISPLGLWVEGANNLNLVDWINSMFTSLKTEDLQMFVLSMWTIWNHRNNIVFENSRLPPPLLFSNIRAMSAAIAWRNSLQRKRSVASAVIRNSEGRVIKSGVRVLQGVTDVELVEAMAVEFGLKLAVDVCCSELIVESDSLGVINKIHNLHSAIDHTQLIIEDCLAILLSYPTRFQHIRKLCNNVAHALAKWSMLVGRNCSFNGEVPFPVNDLIVIFS